jgi:enoyl-CoA hydratase
MTALVTYRLDDSIATITMDDGKVNVLSQQMIAEINAALDRAAADRAVVVLGGREGVFSAGFDLKVLRAQGPESVAMVRGGFELAERVLSFPLPVVMACTGHAFAMGAFLLLSGDYLVGVAGPYKLSANEVAIGIAVPRTGLEVLRQRLAPASFNRAVMLAEVFSPENAVAAGFLDRVVAASEVHEVARSTAVALQALDMDAHAETKLRARENTLRAVRAAIDGDVDDLRQPSPSNA